MDHNLSHYKKGSILEVELLNKKEILLFIIIQKYNDNEEDFNYLVNLETGDRYHINAALFFNIKSITVKRGGLKDEYKT